MTKTVNYNGSLFGLKIELSTGSAPSYNRYIVISSPQHTNIIFDAVTRNYKILDDVPLNLIKEKAKAACEIIISRNKQSSVVETWDGKL